MINIYMTFNFLRILGIVFSLLLFSSCASFQKIEKINIPKNLPSIVEISEVPFYSQQERQCGPASLAMALEWSGVKVDFEKLKEQVFTPGRQGTFPQDMVSGSRRNGRLAYPIRSFPLLLEEIAASNPVIVLQQLKGLFNNDWHYAVVYGYDLKNQEVFLRSGNQSQVKMHFEDFLQTWQAWKKWGLIALPPSNLPKTAKEEIYLKAVLGLEQVGQWKSAEQGYLTAIKKWPKSLAAWMGLGNSRFAQKKLSDAANAFRQATHFHPQSGVAFNNLAHVLNELGQKEEALAASRRAIAIGGPQLETYRLTLSQIKKSH